MEPVLYGLAALIAVTATWLVYELCTAPDGHEDEAGFGPVPLQYSGEFAAMRHGRVAK